jgi:hypothetical protein
VLGNMPAAEVRGVPGRPDLLTHVFSRTPPMSTYLVAFVLASPSSSGSSSSSVAVPDEPALAYVEKQCDLPLPQAAADALARRAAAVASGRDASEDDNAQAFWGPDRGLPTRGRGAASRSVPVRVFGPGGADAAARRLGVALGAACAALQAYEQVLGVPFALPKLDLVAIPNFGAGAMENWGLMLFRESALLVGSASEDGAADAAAAATRAGGGDNDAAQAFRVASTVAHETAHQWFGNLVTLADWTELWLNEGFATYFENVGAAHFRPEYGYFDFFLPGSAAEAFEQDGDAAASRPLSVARSPSSGSEVDDWFDSISYDKGASVLRMLRAWMNRAAPARGVAVGGGEGEEGEEGGDATSAAGGSNSNGAGLLSPPRGPAQTMRRRRRLLGSGAATPASAPSSSQLQPQAQQERWSSLPAFGLDDRGNPARGYDDAKPLPETELSATAPGGGGTADPFLSAVRLYLRRRAFRAADYTALWGAFDDSVASETGEPGSGSTSRPISRRMRAWTLRRDFPVVVAAEVPPPDPTDGGDGDPSSAFSRAQALWPVRVEQEPFHSLPAFRTGKPPSPDYYCNDMTDDVSEASWWLPVAWQEGSLPPTTGALPASAAASSPSAAGTAAAADASATGALSTPDPGRARWQELSRCAGQLAGAKLPQPPTEALAPGLKGGGNSNGTDAAVSAPVDPSTGNRRFVLLNSGRYGYYRTNYTAQLWEALADAAADPRALAAVDLAGLVDDAAALSGARMLSPVVLLRLVSALGLRSTFALTPGQGSGGTWLMPLMPSGVGEEGVEKEGGEDSTAAAALLPPPLPLEYAPWAAAAKALSELRVLLDTAGLREPRWSRCADDLKRFARRNVTGPAVRAHGLEALLASRERAAELDGRESAGGGEARVGRESGGAAASPPSSSSSTGYMPYPASSSHSVVPIGTRLIRPRILLLAGEMGDTALAATARERLLDATADAAAEAEAAGWRWQSAGGDAAGASTAASSPAPPPLAARKAAAAARRAFVPDAAAAALWLAASGAGSSGGSTSSSKKAADDAYARLRLVYAGSDAADLERAQAALAADPSPERAAATLRMALDPRLTKTQDAARLVSAVGAQGGARLAAAWEFLFSREGGGRLFARFSGGGAAYSLGNRLKPLARLMADNGAALPRLEAFAKQHRGGVPPSLVDVARESTARHEDWLQAQGGRMCAWLRAEVGG